MLLVALLIFFGAILQAGLLQDLFKAERELRIILPDSGLSGLAVGSGVEILGTTAGQIDQVVLDPDASFYAIATIDAAMEPFVRQDSTVFIKKQFGIAGAAYLDISRGSGPPLDWDYAVLTAGEETAPTASVGELVEEVRTKILPIVDDTQRAIVAAAILLESLSAPDGPLQTALTDVAKVSTQVAAGEGNVGRLVQNTELARDLEQAVGEVNRLISSFAPVVDNLNQVSGDVAKVTNAVSGQTSKVPEVVGDIAATIDALRAFIEDFSRKAPELAEMVRNSADATTAVPTLLSQTQQTLWELEQLLIQLQGSWLLGGGDGRERIDRLSPVEARP